MKKLIPALITLFLFCSIATARPAKRIYFAKGATKTTVSGKLRGFNDSQVYLLRVKANQKLLISSDDSITVTIKNPKGKDVSDMDLSCNRNKNINPTQAGTYRITVTECKKADRWSGTFRLKISSR